MNVFRSRRNRELGMFRAESLGTASLVGTPTDMGKAKADIRRQREQRTPESRAKERATIKARAEILRARAWWKHRASWKFITIGDRVGKLNVKVGELSGFVEFPDRTKEWWKPTGY